MLAGLVLAMVGLLRAPGADRALPPQSAAQVAGVSISRAELKRAVEAVAADRRTPPDAAQRRQILARLVNEALLIQYGLDLDLVRQSPQLRDQLVDTVLTGLRNEADAQQFEAAEVQAFYREHLALFKGPDLYQVGVIRAAEKSQAQAAFEALQAGGDFRQIQSRYSPGTLILPVAALPPDKLRDYLGPTLTQRAQTLSVGETAPPIADAGGYVIVHLLARKTTTAPPLSQVEEAVRFEMRRRAAETLMQKRLQALRQRYDVSIADDLAGDLADDLQ